MYYALGLIENIKTFYSNSRRPDEGTAAAAAGFGPRAGARAVGPVDSFSDFSRTVDECMSVEGGEVDPFKCGPLITPVAVASSPLFPAIIIIFPAPSYTINTYYAAPPRNDPMSRVPEGGREGDREQFLFREDSFTCFLRVDDQPDPAIWPPTTGPPLVCVHIIYIIRVIILSPHTLHSHVHLLVFMALISVDDRARGTHNHKTV